MVLDIARLALDQIFLEYLAHLVAVTFFHQITGKMRAADDAFTGIAIGTFQTAMDAGLFQTGRHAFGPGMASGANLPQTLDQRRIGRIHLEPDDMQGAPAPGHGNLHTINQLNTVQIRGLPGFIQPCGIIVIGQRQHTQTMFGRVLHEGRRRQQAVRNIRMAVQIYMGEYRQG